MTDSTCLRQWVSAWIQDGCRARYPLDDIAILYVVISNLRMTIAHHTRSGLDDPVVSTPMPLAPAEPRTPSPRPTLTSPWTPSWEGSTERASAAESGLATVQTAARPSPPDPFCTFPGMAGPRRWPGTAYTAGQTAGERYWMMCLLTAPPVGSTAQTPSARLGSPFTTPPHATNGTQVITDGTQNTPSSAETPSSASTFTLLVRNELKQAGHKDVGAHPGGKRHGRGSCDASPTPTSKRRRIEEWVEAADGEMNRTIRIRKSDRRGRRTKEVTKEVAADEVAIAPEAWSERDSVFESGSEGAEEVPVTDDEFESACEEELALVN